MAEYDEFDVGGAHFPLSDQAAGASLLALCDPALAALIPFLAFRINRGLAEALKGAVAAGNPPIGANIRKTFSTDALTNIAKAEQTAFPFFCVHRKSALFSDRTGNWRQGKATLGFAYVLPAMTLEQAEKFSHVLHAVAGIIEHSLYIGFDPNYNDGERLLDVSGIASARLIEVRYEPYRIGDLTDTHFHAVVGDIEVVEQVMPTTTGIQTLSGTAVKITDESAQPGDPVDVINAEV